VQISVIQLKIIIVRFTV